MTQTARKNMVVHLVQAALPVPNADVVVTNKHAQYTLWGHRVCRSFFSFVCNVSEKRLKEVLKECKAAKPGAWPEFADKRKGKKGRGKMGEANDFLRLYATVNGYPNPSGRGRFARRGAITNTPELVHSPTHMP